VRYTYTSMPHPPDDRGLVLPGAYRIICGVRLPSLVAGRFVERDNRFRATVSVAGERVAAHLPNSGRLTELLTADRPCWLACFDTPRRKTRFDLMLVAHDGVLVSVEARPLNYLFAEALTNGWLEPFREYARHERGHVHREVRYGESRLDFRLKGPESVCWVEVKSVTLVESRTARFPDAPTARGTRHIQELSRAVQDGDKAAIVFVVQRGDAQRFAPHDVADAAFGAALREAADAGVGVYAWSCAVSRQTIAVDRQLPVDLR